MPRWLKNRDTSVICWELLGAMASLGVKSLARGWVPMNTTAALLTFSWNPPRLEAFLRVVCAEQQDACAYDDQHRDDDSREHKRRQAR